MKTNIKFAECLYFLLSALDISINRLSKAINVDCSLVNRWIHGKRIPSYSTAYIESIAEYLSRNIQNSYQMQRLQELFLRTCDNMGDGDSTKDKIKKALLESQGYSIECKKDLREYKSHATGKDPTSECMNSHTLHSVQENALPGEAAVCSTGHPIPCIHLSSEDKIIMGHENVLQASLSLMEAAADRKCKNNGPIYISLNNDINIIHRRDDVARWTTAVLKAIRNGWNILFFLRLTNNIDRIIKCIDFARPLIETGNFHPYYFKKYDIYTTGKESLVVPGIGALSCFTSQPHSGIDCAFYFKNQAAVDILRNYFHVWIASSAQPLVKYFASNRNIDYGDCLVKTEESMGKRFLYKNEFSILTLPEHLYKKFLKKKKLSADGMLKALNFYTKRLSAFLSNLQYFEYKDIYMLDSIHNLVKYKQLYFYSYTGMDRMALEDQDIIEHLQNMIALLERYDNYHIAFTHPSEDIGNHTNFYYVVKERQAVMLEAFKPLNDLPEVRLSIEEPMLVKAFEEYFQEIWEQIAPVNKEKKEVIQWLQNHIDTLKHHLPFASFTKPLQ